MKHLKGVTFEDSEQVLFFTLDNSILFETSNHAYLQFDFILMSTGIIWMEELGPFLSLFLISENKEYLKNKKNHLAFGF